MKRWTKGRVFENALKSTDSEHSALGNSRYIYYNFENIQGAANSDFSVGVMAAVITQINLEMIRISQGGPNVIGKRLVLFCDETKFFIDDNAQFFLLTTANFRKFGHSVVLLAQDIQNFQLHRPDGSVDNGIILNSPIRFFFEPKTGAEYLRDEFQMNDREIESLVTNPYRGRISGRLYCKMTWEPGLSGFI